ncbi:MAG: hypothetical protein DYG89_45290 [Caldilinea sp. CFX5]|nr:hypothetical protein [Caldilinea sp. CFX5]
MARDGLVIGLLELASALRPEAIAVVTALRARAQIRTITIVSGDHARPTEQAALLARLQAAGRKVCFVGDGINDAIALKQAHVSISLAGATTAAIDTAHVVFMAGSLAQLPTLFDLAQRFERTQRRMMLPVLGTSVLGLIGIYAWGWGLTIMTLLDQVSLIGGSTVIMQPRLLPQGKRELVG